MFIIQGNNRQTASTGRRLNRDQLVEIKVRRLHRPMREKEARR